MDQAVRQQPQGSHVVRVTGISDELLELLDDRVRSQHGTGRSDYIRELLRRDLLSGPVFRQILASVHEQGNALPDTEEELDAFFDNARDEVFAERRALNC